jgi:hypothetical protein
MTMKKFLIRVFLLCTASLSAQDVLMYRLILTDKGTSPYSISKPEEFLSPKSIDRRIRQGFSVNETDLPISRDYFDAVAETGASIRTYSKWVKTIVVEVTNEETVELLSKLPFVRELYPVWEGVLNETHSLQSTPESNESFYPFQATGFYPEDYGDGFTQISLHNGHLLHNQGYRGENMTIAVMDGGFLNVDQLACFDSNKILDVKNFTHENENPLRSTANHGTKVLSCMLANQPPQMIGTAPEAEYYLFKTEVNESEFPVEEDYWVAAIEYADSLGVDIVSTSLGYFTFEAKSQWNHTHSELDGQTVPASRAAAMAAYKGMILCNSAGNEGADSWEKIIFPSDADNILTVGAIASDSTRGAFSSKGYTGDGRVKPDIVAMGVNATIERSDGKTAKDNGTSFACPIIAGLTASLWQALPDLNSLELMDLIRKSADRYQNPDSLYGYGIPDFFKAYTDRTNKLSISFPSVSDEDVPTCISIYTSMGIKVAESSLKKGIYIVRFQKNNQWHVSKFIKQ